MSDGMIAIICVIGLISVIALLNGGIGNPRSTNSDVYDWWDDD